MSTHAAPIDEPLPEGDELRLAKRLTLRYVLTAQVILGVSGVLGVLLRDSQANLGRLDPNWFYALMTAHGLGAFVGWAGFSVMGLAFWVFAQVGFPIRRFGRAMAEAAYWLMVVGVGGIVVSTLPAALRRLVGVPLSASVPRSRAVGEGLDGDLPVVGAARRPLHRHLVFRRAEHGDQPRAARRLEELVQQVRARARVRLPVAEAVRDEPALGAVRRDPADGDRRGHDHRDAAARGAARRDDRADATSRAGTSIRCSRRTCSGGSATRSCICSSSRRSPSTTCSSHAMRDASSSPATSSPSAGRSRSSRTSSSGRITSTSTIRSTRRRLRSTPRCSR